MSHDRYLYPDDPCYPAAKRLWVSDPIDGSRILRNETRDWLDGWCNEKCVGKYWVGMGFIDFADLEDFVMARLVLISCSGDYDEQG